MKIRKGKVFNLFPAEMRDGEPHMTDCFINNHFMWLFEIMNEIEAFACWCLGIEHYFIIEFDKWDKKNCSCKPSLAADFKHCDYCKDYFDNKYGY